MGPPHAHNTAAKHHDNISLSAHGVQPTPRDAPNGSYMNGNYPPANGNYSMQPPPQFPAPPFVAPMQVMSETQFVKVVPFNQPQMVMMSNGQAHAH